MFNSFWLFMFCVKSHVRQPVVFIFYCLFSFACWCSLNSSYLLGCAYFIFLFFYVPCSITLFHFLKKKEKRKIQKS